MHESHTSQLYFYLTNGIMHGAYITVVVLVVLFGLSYLRSSFNWRISAVFFLFAAAFTCFGFYNIFFISLNKIDQTLYPDSLLKFGAVVTPLAVIILQFLYTRILAMRSVRASAFLHRMWLGNWLIYMVSVGVMAFALFSNNLKHTSHVLLLGFLPALIAAIILSACSVDFKRGKTPRFAYYFMFIFLVVLVATANAAYQSIVHDWYKSEQVLTYSALGFSGLIVLCCWILLRYGIEDIKKFFYIDQHNNFDVLGSMASAINKDEFHLLYQPQVSMETNQVCGVEVLLRWQHPKHGSIAPDVFFPLAEYAGFALTLTEWVAHKALADLKTLTQNHPELTMSLNISPECLTLDFLKWLEAYAEQQQLNKANITLEVTENVMLKAQDHEVREALDYFKRCDFKLSLDDFGTGFSSLSYLQNMVVHELKIDASFTKNLGKNQDTYQIVKALVLLSKSLGITALAEGVENEHQLTLLKQLDCQIAQGYFYAKPMLLDELTQWLVNQNTSFSQNANQPVVQTATSQ